MSKLRIVYLITGLHRCGAEMMLVNLLRGIDRERFAPTVISLMDRGQLGHVLEALDVPVETVGLSAGQPTPTAMFRLIRLVRKARPHLIQGWMYHGNLAAQLVSSFVRVPVCWCIHNSFHSFAAEKPLTRLTIRASARLSTLARRIVYVSHAGRAEHERIGFCAEHASVIPNGIDLDLFKASPEARTTVRAELGIARDTPLVGLIGRVHPQKDHANFLRAAAILARSRPDVHFALAGAGADAGNRELARLHNELQLNGQVHFLGERTDMPRITAALDVATSSSCYGEALSLAIAEAMASSVPCVVTDVGDSGLLVGKTGVVVPPRNSDALAAAWSRLLRLSLIEQQQLGGAARERVAEHYSLGRAVRRYEELYCSLS